MSEENFIKDMLAYSKPPSELSTDQVINKEIMYRLKEKYPDIIKGPRTVDNTDVDYIYFNNENIFYNRMGNPNPFGIEGPVVFSQFGILTIEQEKKQGDKRKSIIESEVIDFIMKDFIDGSPETWGSVDCKNIYNFTTATYFFNLYPDGFDSRNLPLYLYPELLGVMLKRANNNLIAVDKSEKGERSQRTTPEDILSRMA